ncbi:MAG: hypothetical protein M1133_10890, partial [Armatimonadetes bacterium]|nr:hypothetical protein [Armatimonadota bacterium]
REQVRQRAAAVGARAGTDSFGVFQSRAKTWTVVMAGVFVLIVVLAVLVIPRRPHTEAPESLSPSTGLTVPHSAADNTGSEFLSGPDVPTQTHPSKPVPLDGSTGLTSTPSLRTAGEAKVNKELQSVQEGGVKTDDVIADPRQGVVIVTFSVPAGGSTTRGGILASAAAVAKAAFASNGEIKFVTARCLVPGVDGASPQIAFVGDVARVTLDALGAAPSSDAIDKAFTRQWWNPQIR